MKIDCPFCHKKLNSIMSHLKVHKISVSDFAKEHPDFKMVSESTKKKCSKTCINNDVGKQNKGVIRSEDFKNKLSQKMFGENNPFFGKKHSKKTKAQMSKNHADFVGDKNPFKKSYLSASDEYRDEHRKRMAKQWEDVKKDPKKYKKICESNSARTAMLHIDGKLTSYGKGHRHGTFISKKQNKNIFYRSSYELDFLKICEMDDVVLTFDKVNFRIPYKDKSGFVKNYIPDFFVNEKFVVEIKPLSLLKYSHNPYKMKYAKIFCRKMGLSYVVFTKRELGDMLKNGRIECDLSVY